MKQDRDFKKYMYEFNTPNYNKGNIVNLMSSISNSFGKNHSYNQLECLNDEDLNKFDNIVLIVVDGLWYNYLKTQQDSFLYNNLHSKLSTTFLSTTPCANTVFQVWYPPQQHWLTGWTMNLKEIGWITQILPFTLRSCGEKLAKYDFKINEIMDIESYHKWFEGKSFTIVSEEKSRRKFIEYVAKETEIIWTKTYEDTFDTLIELINKKSSDRRFIHVYMDEFDSIQHNYWIGTKESNSIFNNIDTCINNVAKSVQGTNTKLIIVSDHGILNIPKTSEIWVEDIPGLEECLTIPITWEPRVRDCFVRPRKVKEFKKIVKTYLWEYCWCFKWEQLINDNFYGLGVANKKLYDRVGDYVLIMKKDYVLKDHNHHSEKGSHWSLSDDEMLVPLVIVDC